MHYLLDRAEHTTTTHKPICVRIDLGLGIQWTDCTAALLGIARSESTFVFYCLDVSVPLCTECKQPVHMRNMFNTSADRNDRALLNAILSICICQNTGETTKRVWNEREWRRQENNKFVNIILKLPESTNHLYRMVIRSFSLFLGLLFSNVVIIQCENRRPMVTMAAMNQPI